jgi:hypothetical protein
MIEFNYDEDIAKAFELQLRLLDQAHARARGPKARRRIEAKIAETKREAEKLREQAKVVDIEYGRWLRRFNDSQNARFLHRHPSALSSPPSLGSKTATERRMGTATRQARGCRSEGRGSFRCSNRRSRSSALRNRPGETLRSLSRVAGGFFLDLILAF